MTPPTPTRNPQTWEGSFPAVSKPIFTSKYSFCSIFRDLQDSHTFAPFQVQIFNKFSSNFSLIFLKNCKILLFSINFFIFHADFDGFFSEFHDFFQKSVKSPDISKILGIIGVTRFPNYQLFRIIDNWGWGFSPEVGGVVTIRCLWAWRTTKQAGRLTGLKSALQS